MLWIKIILWYGLSLMLAWPALAVTPLHDYFRESWTTRDGLPHNTINNIQQSGDGYLWLATWEGAARYDGRDFTVFGRDAITGLPDVGVRTFFRENDGSLLVAGSRGGVSRVGNGRWQSLPPLGQLINDLLRDQQGQLWFAIEGGGVARQLPDGQYQRFGSDAGLPVRVAYQLQQDRQGTLWVATQQGLYRADPAAAEIRFEQVAVLPDQPDVNVFALTLDQHGRLLVGAEQGLFRFDGQQFSLVNPVLANVAVTALYVDTQNQIWIGTLNQGLQRLSELGIEQLAVQDGLPNNRVLSIFQDSEQSIWVGTNAGLYRLRETPFTNLTQQQGLADNYVRTILEHSDGSVWIGSAGGLDRWSAGQISKIQLNDSVSVLSLAEGADGDVWVGTYGDGAYQLRQGQVVAHYHRGNGLASNEVRAIAPVADEVFIGTSAGLHRLHQQQISLLTVADGLPGNFISALYLQVPDKVQSGQLWIGTGSGAAVWANGKLRPLSLVSQEQAEYVFDFHHDKDSSYVWLATDRGLVRYDFNRNVLRLVGRSAGLPVEKIFALLADNKGDFWLSSNRGIVRISQSDAHAVADGKAQRLAGSDIFGEADGMQSAQCNGGSVPAATVRRDGTLWFATSMGVASVDPARLAQFSLKPPPVVVQQMNADGREVSLQRAELPAGTFRIRVEFAGLSYVMPSRILYRTQLQGVEPDWVERGTANHAEYTNLPPGDYRLLVSAAYPESEWNSDVARIEFRVLPLFWQKGWVQLCAGALTLLALLGFVRWRLYRLSQSELKLKLQVAGKTTELLAQAQSLRQAVAEKTQLAEQLQQQAAAFAAQAREDGLTGLANRRAFDEQLAFEFSRAQRLGQPLCLVMLDIDHFKAINDRWSHQAGDLVLQRLAALLCEEVREIDRIARWGGEEFALLLPQTGLAQAVEISERIRQAIEALDFSADVPGLQVTASFGVAQQQESGSYDKLLSRADQLLYQAKAQGRNCVCS
ncbi:diguanylate cyclase [Rheinheimera texasensis]|uniref:diguanylate cyclase n=1 Tax=Rheinheimera texasensis TaxID=306205 RepID=UPI0032B169DD